jgi:hypothetical protein
MAHVPVLSDKTGAIIPQRATLDPAAVLRLIGDSPTPTDPPALRDRLEQ